MTCPAIYARSSVENCDLQVERLGAWCKATGLGDPVVFRDDGVSGVLDNRPALDELRRRMLAGEFRAVIVSRIDRLGRSVGMILRFWDEADALGVRVVVIDQAIDTATPAGRLMRTMLAAIAEFDREQILEKTAAGIARARRLGKRFGRPPTVPADVAVAIVARRRDGQSLRDISMYMGVKLGAVRSVLRRMGAEARGIGPTSDRDQSPPLKTDGSEQGADRAA